MWLVGSIKKNMGLMARCFMQVFTQLDNVSGNYFVVCACQGIRSNV